MYNLGLREIQGLAWTFKMSLIRLIEQTFMLIPLIKHISQLHSANIGIPFSQTTCLLNKKDLTCEHKKAC